MGDACEQSRLLEYRLCSVLSQSDTRLGVKTTGISNSLIACSQNDRNLRRIKPALKTLLLVVKTLPRTFFHQKMENTKVRI